LKDFETAEASFDAVQRLDPYRLDDIDTYSNMLYVIPKTSKLAQLAKEYSNIDRNRAETCTLIGKSTLGPSKPLDAARRSLRPELTFAPGRDQATSTRREESTQRRSSTSVGHCS
jgi:hypothetical protein